MNVRALLRAELTRSIALSLGLFLTASSAALAGTWDAGAAPNINWSAVENWSDDASPAGQAIIFSGTGLTANATTVGNIVDQSLSITSLDYAQNSTQFQVTEIASGATLTITGTTAGVNAFGMTGNTITTVKAVIKGSTPGTGTLIIDNALANNNNFALTNTASSGSTPAVYSLDMSSLGTFQATVANFNIGTGNGRGRGEVTLAQSNTITATKVLIGGNNSSTAVSGNFLKLGQNNTINTDTFVLAAGRSSGFIEYQTGLTGTPTTVIRGANGTSRVGTMSIGINSTSFGGVANGSTPSNGVMDFTGGSVDLLVNNLYLGVAQSQTGTAYSFPVGTLTFDTGTVDVTTAFIGVALNQGTGSGTLVWPATRSQLNVQGGTFNAGNVNIARNEDQSSGPNYAIAGELNISGGTTTITGNINAANHTSTSVGLSSGFMNFTGGTISIGGNITEGADATNLSTLRLDGADLDMTAGTINVDTFDAQSGILRNVAEIQSNTTVAGLIKSAGTVGNTLTLLGTNTYTGTTTLTAGTLLVNGTHTNGGAYAVQTGATLGGTGSIGSAVAVDSGAFLAPGASIESLAITGALALNGTLLAELNNAGQADLLELGSTLSLGLNSTLDLNNLDSNPSLNGLYTLAQFAPGSLSGTFGSVLYEGSAIANPTDAFSIGGTHQLVYDNLGGSLQLVQSIPEPGTWAVMIIGMAGVWTWRRRLCQAAC
jgi:fibronectin-binding autotransporter adhesin